MDATPSVAMMDAQLPLTETAAWTEPVFPRSMHTPRCKGALNLLAQSLTYYRSKKGPKKPNVAKWQLPFQSKEIIGVSTDRHIQSST
jgi:hypothetical protein